MVVAPQPLVLGGGRLGTGAVVLPAQVFRPLRSAMLVQPQERLLSQHRQAWFAGGGSSRFGDRRRRSPSALMWSSPLVLTSRWKDERDRGETRRASLV